MIALLFTLLILVLPNVYAQVEQKYNPTSDAFDNLVYTLLPLIVISSYQSEGRIRDIIGIIEFTIGGLVLFIFPPVYNFFIYKTTSKFDYVCMVSALIFVLGILVRIIAFFFDNDKDAIESLYRLLWINQQWWKKFIFAVGLIIGFIVAASLCITLMFLFAIYWIKKNDISEKIGYEWFIVISSTIILIVVILFLFGRPRLALYFYMVVSVGLTFSIGYSNNEFFTKLFLAMMSYFLGRMFDKGVFIGKFINNFDYGLRHRYCFKFVSKKMLRFYIDEIDKDRINEIKFSVGSVRDGNDEKLKERGKLVEVVCDDNINNRVAYYLHDIQTLFIQINKDHPVEYHLNEMKKGVLVQTPRLNGIILTMVLLDDDDNESQININGVTVM